MGMEQPGELDGVVSRARWLARKLAKVDNITAYHYYGAIV
jgi:hypothetical protein